MVKYVRRQNSWATIQYSIELYTVTGYGLVYLCSNSGRGKVQRLGPPPPIKWVPGALSPELKWPERYCLLTARSYRASPLGRLMDYMQWQLQFVEKRVVMQVGPDVEAACYVKSNGLEPLSCCLAFLQTGYGCWRTRIQYQASARKFVFVLRQRLKLAILYSLYSVVLLLFTSIVCT